MSAYSSPVFSVAGAMPGEPEMTHWKTAYVNPDASVTTRVRRPRPHGPSLSIAGAMPVAPTMSHWHTAYPTARAPTSRLCATPSCGPRPWAAGPRSCPSGAGGGRCRRRRRGQGSQPRMPGTFSGRRSMLPKARERAATLCQRGAMFPWRTINGEEASASYQAGTAQYHLNADIAYAIRRYVDARG